MRAWKITDKYGKCYRGGSGICHRSLEKSILRDFEGLGILSQRGYLCWVLRHSQEFSKVKTGERTGEEAERTHKE